MRKFLLLSLILYVAISCNETEIPDGRFIGKWISSERQDTINFETNSDLYRGYYDGLHHFDYSYTNDSITIQYSGPNMILVYPTTHKYELHEKRLIINFESHCYGFSPGKDTLIKIN